tara:strand:+ start:22639 stop:22827 length:189 start_codon:yes stop_codon:yes gene_type:complete
VQPVLENFQLPAQGRLLLTLRAAKRAASLVDTIDLDFHVTTFFTTSARLVSNVFAFYGMRRL